MPDDDVGGGEEIDTEVDGDAPWMKVAQYYRGKKVKEVRGGENQDIIRFFKEIKKPEFNEDEIPWCAAFVGACLYEANYGHNGSAWAAHYGIWDGADLITQRKGKTIDMSDCEYGDIVVMTRKGGGHVAFFVEYHGNGSVSLLGGNQADSVNVTRYPTTNIQKVVRPNGTGTPKWAPDQPAGVIGPPMNKMIPVKPGKAPVTPPVTEPTVTKPPMTATPVKDEGGISAKDVALGAGGVAGAAGSAWSTGDILTGIVVLLVVAGLLGYFWYRRNHD
jgi:uncharacterized protein (TIGR02594 family)